MESKNCRQRSCGGVRGEVELIAMAKEKSATVLTPKLSKAPTEFNVEEKRRSSFKKTASFFPYHSLESI